MKWRKVTMPDGRRAKVAVIQRGGKRVVIVKVAR